MCRVCTHCLCFSSVGPTFSPSELYRHMSHAHLHAHAHAHVYAWEAHKHTNTHTHMCHDDRTHSFKIHSSQFSRWAQLLTCHLCKMLPQWLLHNTTEFDWVFRIIYYNNFTVSIQFFPLRLFPFPFPFQSIHRFFLSFDCHIRAIKWQLK